MVSASKSGLMDAIIPLPAFRDNYIWLLRRGRHAVVVDPGDAAPVLEYLQAEGLTLSAILVTHHHPDHVGGLGALLSAKEIPVFGPSRENIAGVNRPVAEGDTVALPELGLTLGVLDVPGHTAGHIAYYGVGMLFCGDTLFSAGCGRLFEGSPAQMAASLAKFNALPAETKVYCTHEYTLSNLAFSRAAEPCNPARDEYAQWCEAQRADGKPTLPSTIERERAINPFLRTQEAGVLGAVSQHTGNQPADAVACLAALRAWKDVF
jgi:hydroxyacylglutathione hydrolase